MHPIFNNWKQHNGVDYGAPIGTPVRTVGDGVIEFAGWQNGYGNVVHVRHSNERSTVYAHLSRVDVAKGEKVDIGTIIGAVGQTGWATGPHLHYEFRVNGQSRNPMSIAMPAASRVPAAELAAFHAQAAPLIARLELLANSNLALLE
jgi:murein DD-endopeptidase MepM/ murein hydrolase activator NlpD